MSNRNTSYFTDTAPEAPTHKKVDSEQQKFNLFFKWLRRAAIALFVLSILAVLSLRWVNPFTSSFILQHRIESWFSNENITIRYDWVGYENISAYIKLAAITSEDQTFPDHWGFSIKQIKEAVDNFRDGEELRGASTITQQTAKNLFLYPKQNFFRKAIEAYFTILLELFLSKERILEIYLNIAAFGDGVYGVETAARRYFGTSAGNLSMIQSALMITALPDPDDYNLAAPSSYMIQRRNWVLEYMMYLGGTNYLNRL